MTHQKKDVTARPAQIQRISESYKHLKACPRKSGDACLTEKSAKIKAHDARRTSVNQYTPTNHIINPCFPVKIPLDARK